MPISCPLLPDLAQKRAQSQIPRNHVTDPPSIASTTSFPMLLGPRKILDTLTDAFQEISGRITGTGQAESSQENEEDRILSDAWQIDLDTTPPPDSQPRTYWPPEKFAEFEDVLGKSLSFTSFERSTPRPNYASGDSVSVVRHSGSAAMGKKKDLGGFKPHDGINNRKSDRSFSGGISDYMSSRKPAVQLDMQTLAQRSATGSVISPASELPPRAKRQRTNAHERNVMRYKDDITSPYFNAIPANQSIDDPEVVVVDRPSQRGKDSEKHKSRQRSTQTEDYDVKMSDGFDPNLNVLGQNTPQVGKPSSEQVLPTRPKKFPAKKTASTIVETPSGPITSKSRAPLVNIDDELDTIKSVKGPNGVIEPRVLSSSTSNLQARTDTSQSAHVEASNKPLNIMAHRPKNLANSAAARRSRPVPVASVDIDVNEVHSTVQSTNPTTLSAVTPPKTHERHQSEITALSSGDESDDSNAADIPTSTFTHHAKSETVLIPRQPKAAQKVGRLTAYYDVYGHNLDMTETYVWFHREQGRFQVLSQTSGQQFYLYFDDINRYFTGEDSSVVSVISEGPKVMEGLRRPATFWAAFTFDNHSSAWDLRLKLNVAIARAPSKTNIYANIDKDEAWLQRMITNKRSTLMSTVPLSKPVKINYPPSATEAEGNLAKQVVSKTRSNIATENGTVGKDFVAPKKLRNNLRSDEVDQGHTIKGLDTDKHDAVTYENSSEPDPSATRTTRRSMRNAGLTLAETAKTNDNVRPPQPRVANIVAEPPKSRYPPFKDWPEAKKPWPQPLVYPSTGPNRATVEFDDLHRLDDEQLLNDNLVQFGIKFAQELYPRLNDKIYVFNTYFYTSLTNRGPKTLNYDAVKRWTAKVDIFQYDHVVVPINQSTHWYMAIICNIKNIFTEEAARIDEEDDNLDNDRTEQLPSQVGNLTIKSGEAGLPENINQPDSVPPSSLPEQPEDADRPNGKNQGQQRRKVDPSIPMIVTLDSLGTGRSPVVGILKAYLRDEASSKKGKVIPEIFMKRQGMSAKGIPQQTNFSDCGIYLVYYLAKFLDKPVEFMKKLIAKEFKGDEDWLDSQDPSSMRDGFRKVIIAKYLEQNPMFCEDDATLKDAKAILNTKKIFGGKGEAVQPVGGNIQPRTGSTTGKLPSKKRSSDSAINKPFKSPVIKNPQPQELAQAPSMEIPNSDDEGLSTAPKAATTRTPRAQSKRKLQGIAHVLDKLEDDLQDRSAGPESSPRHTANPSSLKRRRSIIFKDTFDELGATPDHEHRMDFVQSHSRNNRDSTGPATRAAIVSDKNGELSGAETASSVSSVPTSSVEYMEGMNQREEGGDVPSNEDDAPAEADESAAKMSSLSHRRRSQVVLDVNEVADENNGDPALLLSSSNSPNPSYQGFSGKRQAGTSRQAKAMDNHLFMQGLMQYALVDDDDDDAGPDNGDAMDLDERLDVNDEVGTKASEDEEMSVDQGEESDGGSDDDIMP